MLAAIPLNESRPAIRTDISIKRLQEKDTKLSLLDECTQLGPQFGLGPVQVFNASLEKEIVVGPCLAEGYQILAEGIIQIKDDSIHIDKTRNLKKSGFSHVDFGVYIQEGKCDQSIARKRPELPINKEYAAFKKFLMEIKLHASIEDHPNIVKLIGATASRENLRNYNVGAILEYCHEGDLESYLKRNHSHFDDSDMEDRSVFKLKTINLLNWAKDVASGMEFLSSKGIVHMDLAARNVLLAHKNMEAVNGLKTDPGQLVAKIGDFGLSRNLNGDPFIQFQSGDVLPYYYYPPKSRKLLRFYPEDDIWCIGLLYYKMFNLGVWTTVEDVDVLDRRETNQSEENLKMDDNFLNGDTQNFKNLPRPLHAPLEIWSIITQYMMENRSERPSFTQIKLDIEDFLESFIPIQPVKPPPPKPIARSTQVRIAIPTEISTNNSPYFSTVPIDNVTE